MKIRSSKSFFNSDLSEEDLKGHLLPDIEDTSYPITISNNECLVESGNETLKEDSPLSFLVKFKASFVKPKGITIGVSGFELPNKGFKNMQLNDNQSPFQSVNCNHFDLTLKDEKDLNHLVDSIIEIQPHHHSFDLDDIKNYVLAKLNVPEWSEFFCSNKDWNRFKNGFLREEFVSSHCEINQDALAQYKKKNINNNKLFEDLRLLKVHGAITDDKQIKAVKNLFPDIYS